jgi:N-terminal domain of NWD NACHT-NTPase
VVGLYVQILEYEARAACQFNRNTAFQLARNIVQADGWEAILEKIKESEMACDQLIRIIDAKDQQASMKQLEAKLDRQNLEVEERLRDSRIQDEEYEKRVLAELKASRKEQKAWRQTDEECNCHQILRTSNYEEHMARNPDRVDGTCQ